MEDPKQRENEERRVWENEKSELLRKIQELEDRVQVGITMHGRCLVEI